MNADTVGMAAERSHFEEKKDGNHPSTVLWNST